MAYQFHTHTLSALQSAFLDFAIQQEKTRKNAFRNWDYLFLKFKSPVILNLQEDANSASDLVDVIFAGDAELSKQFKQHFGTHTQLEIGLRWIGSSSAERIIYATGLAMIVSYPYNAATPINHDIVFDLLVKADFLSADELSSTAIRGKKFVSLNDNNAASPYCFFKRNSLTYATKFATEYISQHIPAVKPKYRRPSETGINPTYQTLDTLTGPLRRNEKIIWLLRSDRTIAIGNKNAYWISFGTDELAKSVPQSLHQYVNWDDRAGHPSLAVPENEYDGSGLYGGYICQKENHLQVFTSSGRYYRDDLSLEEKIVLETYIASQLQQSLGEQDIIFYEGPYKDFYELSLFFADQPFPPSVNKRIYISDNIKQTFETMAQDVRINRL